MLKLSAQSDGVRCSAQRAFTMVELMTVIVVMLILATMSISAFGYLRERSERATCFSNLQNLYTACGAYMSDNNNVWPQIPTQAVTSPSFALAWINALAPYQLGPVNWICPTTQRALKNPNYLDPKNARVDYVGMAYNNQPYAAYHWSTQPWFAEDGPGHGDGPLLILASGQILSLQQTTQITAQPLP